MIANIIEADLFINLTSTAGLYDGNPSVNKKAKLIPVVSEFSEEIEAAATSDTSSAGTGGMKSKIQAAKKVTAIGIPCIIASGKKDQVLTDIMAGKEIGTLFLPMADRLNSKKYWIAFTLRPRGKLVIDDGAKKALLEKGKSLLPSGVLEVEGDFEPGDPVTCVAKDGIILAKGLVNFNSGELNKIKGLKTSQIKQVLGHKDYDEVIHRDNLAVTKQIYKNKPPS
jgi:glutamate 5-kinase